MISVCLQVDRDNPWFGAIPRVKLEDKSTYTESDTKKFDTVRSHLLVFCAKFSIFAPVREMC